MYNLEIAEFDMVRHSMTRRKATQHDTAYAQSRY